MHGHRRARHEAVLLLLLSLALGTRGWSSSGLFVQTQIRRAQSLAAPPPQAPARQPVLFSSAQARHEALEATSTADLTTEPPRSRGGVLGLLKNVLLFLPLLLRRIMAGLRQSLFGRRDAGMDDAPSGTSEPSAVDEALAVPRKESIASTPQTAVKQLTRMELERVKRSFQAAEERSEETQGSQQPPSSDLLRASTDLLQLASGKLWRSGQQRIEELNARQIPREARQVWGRVKDQVQSFERWQDKTFFSSTGK